MVSAPLTLKRARLECGMDTAAKLARASGIDHSIISRIENGGRGRGISYDVAHQLSKALKKRITDIHWPTELTTKGRPLGTKINPGSSDLDEVKRSSLCPIHFVVLPSKGCCDSCD